MQKLENQVDILLKQNEKLIANGEKILQMSYDKDLLDINAALNDKKVAITYAYRYLLNREPESIQIVENNTMEWKALRKNFVQSLEYKKCRI